MVCTFVICGLIAATVWSAASAWSPLAGAGAAHTPENLLRMHVLAHSDDPEDQRVKLRVRDAILAELQRWEPVSSAGEAEALLIARKDELIRAAEAALRREGHAETVRIEVGDFAFPEKVSGSIVLPAGTYRAFRVVIGDGAGQNWWCVLFPPLCFVEDVAGVTPGRNSVASAAPRPEGGVRPLNRLEFSGAGERDDAGERARSGEAKAGEVRASAGEDETGKGDGRVQWRLGVWERISRSAAAATVRDWLEISLRK